MGLLLAFGMEVWGTGRRRPYHALLILRYYGCCRTAGRGWKHPRADLSVFDELESVSDQPSIGHHNHQ
jgi:hypothetical protein